MMYIDRMLPLYSQSELIKRNKILKSQLLLSNIYDATTINTLINLFDKTKYNLNSDPKIVKYIKDERDKQGLSSAGVEIVSEVYGYDAKNSTVYLGIKKNKIEFLHLTIHLSVKGLNPKDTGMIHIRKNIYKTVNSSIAKRLLYSLIEVRQPANKPHSLIFSIGDGFSTVGVKNSHIYDPEIQQEMNVIITVLNRIFDEYDEYYIGNNKNESISIKTNWVLKNINQHTKYITRKNKGVLFINNSHNKIPINFNSSVYIAKQKSKSKRGNTKRAPRK